MENKKQIEERIELISNTGRYGTGLKKEINKREVYDMMLLELLKQSDENIKSPSLDKSKVTKITYDDSTYYQTMVLMFFLESLLKGQGKEFSIMLDKDNNYFILIIDEKSLNVLYLLIEFIKSLKEQYVSYFYDQFDRNIKEVETPTSCMKFKLAECMKLNLFDDLNKLRDEICENTIKVISQYNSIIGEKLTNKLINNVRDIIYQDNKDFLNNTMLPQLTDALNIISEGYLGKNHKIEKEYLKSILNKPCFLDIINGMSLIHLIKYQVFVKNYYIDFIDSMNERHYFHIDISNAGELFDKLSVNYILSSIWNELNK